MLRVPTNSSTLATRVTTSRPNAEDQDKEVGHHGRHEKVPPLDRDPVKEDHRHGVLQDRERERAEEQHGHEQKAAHHLAVGQKNPQFRDQGVRLTRDNKPEILLQGEQELVLAEEVREHDQDQDQQGHKREQGVVGDGPREQDALVGPKAFEHSKRERAGALEHPGGSPTEVPHRKNRYEGSGQRAGAVSSDAAAEPRTPPHRIALAGWEGNGRRVQKGGGMADGTPAGAQRGASKR